MGEYELLKLVAALGVGLAVGGGIMILAIAKWGRKFFAGEKGDRGDVGPSACPFAQDHPKLQEFMGESLRDRREMRSFLEDINGKVGYVSGNVFEMKGKLDLLLQGARVRWNSGLIPDNNKDKP